jgi:hypothetical protein
VLMHFQLAASAVKAPLEALESGLTEGYIYHKH